MAIPAWIAIITEGPLRRRSNTRSPVNSAPLSSQPATGPNAAAPASVPRGGPNATGSNRKRPTRPAAACEIPATSGGRTVPRRCSKAKTAPAATTSVSRQIAAVSKPGSGQNAEPSQACDLVAAVAGLAQYVLIVLTDGGSTPRRDFLYTIDVEWRHDSHAIAVVE